MESILFPIKLYLYMIYFPHQNSSPRCIIHIDQDLIKIIITIKSITWEIMFITKVDSR